MQAHTHSVSRRGPYMCRRRCGPLAFRAYARKCERTVAVIFNPNMLRARSMGKKPNRAGQKKKKKRVVNFSFWFYLCCTSGRQTVGWKFIKVIFAEDRFKIRTGNDLAFLRYVLSKTISTCEVTAVLATIFRVFIRVEAYSDCTKKTFGLR